MKRKISFIFVLLCLVFTAPALAGQLNQAQALFYQGNSRYSEGDFEAAIAAYEGALTLGVESGALYYNLGNAYFKQGGLGKAILNYLRAKRLIPQDADLKSNLNYAQSLIEGGETDYKPAWIRRVFLNLADNLSLDTLTLVSAVLYCVLAALIMLILTVKRLGKSLFYPNIIVSIAFIIYLGLFSAQLYHIVLQKQAVVIVDALDSKFEPFDDATTFFNLYEGEMVSVEAVNKDWLKIKRNDGKQGWVRQSELELL